MARKTAKVSVVSTRATLSSKEADQWVTAARKAKTKGQTVTRRRETFSFGVVYVVLTVKAA